MPPSGRPRRSAFPSRLVGRPARAPRARRRASRRSPRACRRRTCRRPGSCPSRGSRPIGSRERSVARDGAPERRSTTDRACRRHGSASRAMRCRADPRARSRRPAAATPDRARSRAGGATAGRPRSSTCGSRAGLRARVRSSRSIPSRAGRARSRRARKRSRRSRSPSRRRAGPRIDPEGQPRGRSGFRPIALDDRAAVDVEPPRVPSHAANAGSTARLASERWRCGIPPPGSGERLRRQRTAAASAVACSCSQLSGPRPQTRPPTRRSGRRAELIAQRDRRHASALPASCRSPGRSCRSSA
jgi:hypothetical protein